ncbi:MAG: DotU family type IV/VI secretion system protein [Myxococcales bacterium]|nr:DotU family type IV/VI secretion system protein [Myxococcales bacterium]
MDKIDDLTSDVFNFLIQLRRLDPAQQPPPESVQQRLRALIDTLGRRGEELKLAREDVLEITYAIIALADEVAIYAGGNLRQFWMSRPLQLQYFNENQAGENFFVRVNALRTDPRRVDVVRVYYMCLVLGFQGRYRVRGGEAELAAIMDTLAADLARAGYAGPELLSVQGDRPAGEKRGPSKVDLPVVALSFGALVLALIFYIGLRISLDNEVSRVLQRIGQIVQ